MGASVMRERVAALRSGWGAALLTTAVLLVVAVVVADFVTPPDKVFFWLILLAPVLAAILLRPWAVAVVGLVALILVWVMSSRGGMSGTVDQAMRLGAIVGITLLSAGFAHRLGVLERRAHRGAEQESTLAAIVRSSEDAVITTDLDGTITTWNDGATRQYGWRADEAIGRCIALVYTHDQIFVMPDTLAGLSAGKRRGPIEAHRVRKDGSHVEVLVSMWPVRDRFGQVVSVARIERDLTAVKQAEEQRRLVIERSALAERLECLGQLAGGVAHDFNNLLAINLNYLDFVLERTADAETREDLTRARTSAERARELTRQLLLFARQEPGDAEVIDVDSVIEDARALLGRTIGGHVELIARRSPEPLAVRCDWGRMEQVLLNLVINARDAMPDGGTVVIEAQPGPARARSRPAAAAARRPVRAAEGQRHGHGDAPGGRRPHLRAVLHDQGRAARHRAGPGDGVLHRDRGGRRHHGVVRAGRRHHLPDPAAGRLRPPWRARAAPPGGRGAARRRRAAAGRASSSWRTTPRSAGSPCGSWRAPSYRVTEAANGRVALDRINRGPFDLLLTDIVMPEMSGSRLAETVLLHHPGTRIVLISGYSEECTRVRHLTVEGIEMIHKPFTADELLGAVRRVLGVATDRGQAAVGAPKTTGTPGE
nr:hypothetical protein GCM10020092_044130 [Actinoplanes digitatis]